MLHFELREDEPDLDEAAPAEAKAAHKALESLLGLKSLPKSVRDAAASARTALGKRLPVWDDLHVDDPATEAEVVVATDFPLTEATAGTGEYDVRIIAPGWGSSGYYSKDCLREAAANKVFPAGLKMFADHPSRSEAKDRPERSIRDLAGVLASDATYQEAGSEGPGLYARARVYAPFQPIIKAMAKDIGLSIRASGTGREGTVDGRTGRLVEGIHGAKSVDFVTAAGAGGKFINLLESAGLGSDPPEGNGMNLEEAQREAAAAKAKVTELEEAARVQTQALARANERLLLNEAAREADALLAPMKNVPDVTKTRIAESVARQAKADKDGALDKAALKTTLDEAVKQEVEYLEAVVGKGKIRGMGGEGGDGDVSLEESKKALDAAFGRLIPDEKRRAIAVNGRNG